MSIASLGVGITGSVLEYKQAKKNAKILEKRGFREADRAFREGRRVLGGQRAGFSASGVTLEGTPQDVANSTISLILDEAVRRSSPFLEGAAAMRREAKLKLATSLASSVTSFAGGVAGGIGAGAGSPSASPSLTGTPGQSAMFGPGTTVRPGGGVGMIA
jgi:hypothetical protein